MNRSVSLFGKEQGQDQENKKEEGRKNCNALRLSGDSSFSRSRTKSIRPQPYFSFLHSIVELF